MIGIPDEEAGEVPKGFVVLRSGQQVTEVELLASANEKVPGYKKLHVIAFIDVLSA